MATDWLDEMMKNGLEFYSLRVQRLVGRLRAAEEVIALIKLPSGHAETCPPCNKTKAALAKWEATRNG